MTAPDVVVTVVFRTLLRATADARSTVVLRSDDQATARAVAHWLARAHGSQRTVIASRTAAADIVLRLPARLEWNAVPRVS